MYEKPGKKHIRKHSILKEENKSTTNIGASLTPDFRDKEESNNNGGYFPKGPPGMQLNSPGCVKVEATEAVKVPRRVDDGAEYAVGGVGQRSVFIIDEVVESGLCRLHDLQRSYSLCHLRLSYKRRFSSDLF